MECPNCHFVVVQSDRICPSCNLPIYPERRKGERRRMKGSPPDGIERRKGSRRRGGGKDSIAWGV